MRAATTTFCLAFAYIVCTADSLAAVLVEGTLVRVAPQGIVVKTTAGETPFVITPTNRLIVRTPANIDQLADGTPCLLQAGTIRPGGTEITSGFLLVVRTQRPDFDDHVMLRSDGSVSFQNAPGILKKGPPLAFTTGPRQEHLVLDATGRLRPAPPAQQALFNNRTIAFAAGRVSAEYDFGADLRMAGANAKVRIIGDANNPTAATIHIDRTESFTPR